MSDTPAQRLNTLRLITVAMMASGVVYAAVLFALDAEGGAGGDLWVPMYAAAAAAAVGSFVLPRLLAGEPAGDLTAAVHRFYSQHIIAIAMSEAVILFGFAGAFVSQEPLGIVPFVVVGEVLMLARFPRDAAFEATLSPQAQIEWARQQG